MGKIIILKYQKTMERKMRYKAVGLLIIFTVNISFSNQLVNRIVGYCPQTKDLTKRDDGSYFARYRDIFFDNQNNDRHDTNPVSFNHVEIHHSDMRCLYNSDRKGIYFGLDANGYKYKSYSNNWIYNKNTSGTGSKEENTTQTYSTPLFTYL